MWGCLLGRWEGSWTSSVVEVEHNSIEVEEVENSIGNLGDSNITELLLAQAIQFIHLYCSSVTSLSPWKVEWTIFIQSGWEGKTCSLQFPRGGPGASWLDPQVLFHSIKSLLVHGQAKSLVLCCQPIT